MHIKRTQSDNPDFKELVTLLDADLAIKDGDDHAFYHQFNDIESLNFVIVAYENDKPIGCGAIKKFSDESVEVKRMFTLPEARGKGIATVILRELENWAAELSFRKCILETGIRQPDAIALYEKNGYKSISNYGQYAGVVNSRCFEKQIS